MSNSRDGGNSGREKERHGFLMLESKRLVLRDHRDSDLSTHHALLSDSAAMYYLPDIKTSSLAASEANLAFSMREIGQDMRAHVFLRMEDKSTGCHIGEIGYTASAFTPLGKLVDLGYFTYPRFWNQG